jgi:hypothetical protein
MFRSPMSKVHNNFFNRWSLIFPGSDRAIAVRTAYYKWQVLKQRPVRPRVRAQFV